MALSYFLYYLAGYKIITYLCYANIIQVVWAVLSNGIDYTDHDNRYHQI